ncbi:MAG TPA: hypothetical protein VGJ30_20965 [Candidatus Angelobacter sp.]
MKLLENADLTEFSDQLQVSDAVFVTLVPSPAAAVAVMVAAPVVAPLQVALPRVESWALLTLTLMLSETDQVPVVRLLWDTTHPGVTAEAKASKCCVLPGGGAVWLMVVLAGKTLIAVILQASVIGLFPPHPMVAK